MLKNQVVNSESGDTVKRYVPIPTLLQFHKSPAQIRCIVGPVGSSKTTGAAWEMCHFVPKFLAKKYGIKKTRWVVVRNTYVELVDTTLQTVLDWFGDSGKYYPGRQIFELKGPDGIEVEILFRSCDRKEDVKKFKSLELTGYWIDESIEVSDDVRKMLKNRIGRYPQKSPVRFGIETTNPPDTEHPTYRNFAWASPPPGPVPEGTPLENHAGFWQPPYENAKNLRPGYYEDLKGDYADSPDWLEMYVLGKPGIVTQGKLVYANFKRDYHVGKSSLAYAGGPLIRGWDNSGNCPACVLAQMPTAGHVQILKEWHTEKQGIVDFTRRVVMDCAASFPGATFTDWGDPAGANKFSKRDGGFTSNAQLQADECGVTILSSEQNFTARVQGVDQALGRIDGILIDPGCTRLINGFIGGYHYPEIGTTGEFGREPVKNKFSHVHDALQYLLVKLGNQRKNVMTKDRAKQLYERYAPPCPV